MTDSRDLSFTLQLNCSPEAAFRCWTEPDLLRRFFAPAPGRTTEAVIDLRPGGRFYTLMVFEDHGEIGGEGCILHVEPGRRLVFTDALAADWRPNAGAFFTCDLEFRPADGGGCIYCVTTRHASPEAAKQHEDMGFYDGWTQVARQLEQVAAELG